MNLDVCRNPIDEVMLMHLSTEWHTPLPSSTVSQMWVIDQWQYDANVSHWTTIVSHQHDWGVSHITSNVSHHCDQGLDCCQSIVTLHRDINCIHIFQFNIGDPHVSQNCKLCINFVTEVWVILHGLSVTEVTEGVRHCTCFVNTVVDNDWPCPGVVGCVIQLTSALYTALVIYVNIT